MGKIEFGSSLKRLREQAGLSQRQLASKVGINFTYLSKIENGVMPPPSEEVILKLADTLNCDSDELLILAGKVPSDIAQILKNQEILQSLRADGAKKKTWTASAGDSFSKRLRELREGAGLSQSELANKIGVNFTYLSKIENGIKPPPSEKVILKLADALNCDSDELLSLAGKLPPDIARILKNQEILQSLRAGGIKKTGTASNRKGVNAMKYLLNGKSLARAALAIVLVCAVAASLWFASPTPVRALTFSYPSLPSTGTLGSTYTFQVTVNVETQDLLPIHSIDLEIRNSASPGTYTATATSLPIPGVALSSTSKSYTSAQTGGGTVTATASSAYGWVWGSGSRSGYGYRDPEGLGYHTIGGTTFGYGYGYDSNRGITSITYTITWVPPTNWPEGNYNIRTFVYGDAAKTKKWSGTSATFSLSAVAEDDDDGVVGAGAPPAAPAPEVIEPGVVDVSSVVQTDGEFTQDVNVESADGSLTISIEAGNVGTTADGSAISIITITEVADPPLAPTDASIIGITYDIDAEDATFENPVTITLTYDPDNLPAGVNEEDLALALWDEVLEEWVPVPTIVDPVTNTLTAEITHFSKYAILAYTPPEPQPAVFTVSALSISPAEVAIGESVTISVLAANTGDLSGSYEVALKVNNAVVDTKVLTSLAGGSSQTATFTISRDAAGTYNIEVNGLTGSFIVRSAEIPATPAPAAFTTSALTVSQTEVNSGQTVNIGVLVSNTGELSGSYSVTLKINNVVVDTKDVTLASGTNQKVTFTTTQEVAGTYTVTIDAQSGTFTVTAPPSVPEPAPVTWWVWLIVGLSAIAVVVVIVWLVLRRRIA